MWPTAVSCPFVFLIIQNDIRKEMERRKTGKDLQDFKRKQEEEKTKRLMEERNREKAEDKAARDRVKQQIAMVTAFFLYPLFEMWIK